VGLLVGLVIRRRVRWVGITWWIRVLFVAAIVLKETEEVRDG
jgi:hypothetical protein